jgi:drug/metabolite transporter (DMT)-like permease
MRQGLSRLPMLPFFLLTVAVLFWAGNWAAARALRFDVPPVAMAFWRWVIALTLFALISGSMLRSQWRLALSSWKTLCLLGLLATVFQHIPIYIGLKYTTATNGAILNATSPIFIILLSWLVLGERLGARAALGVLASLSGALWIVIRGNFALLAAFKFNVGDLWILLATVAWAGYTVCLRWRPAVLHPLVFLTSMSVVGVAAMAPLYAAEIASGAVLKVNAAAILGIAYVGTFATVLAYIFWNNGVQQVGANRAGPFMYLMPVFTFLLSTLFLGEEPHLYHAVGIVLVFSGIYLTSRPARSAKPQEVNPRPQT